MIALANHNNDIAEYWEWSAEGLYNPDPTSDAYRLGVNYYRLRDDALRRSAMVRYCDGRCADGASASVRDAPRAAAPGRGRPVRAASGCAADASRPSTTATIVFTRIRYNARARLARGSSAVAAGSTTTRRRIATSRRFVDYITNVRVRVDGSNILDLDDPRIFENPIIYMSEPGFWTTQRRGSEEPARLPARRAAFIIFDDFEGDGDWANLVTQMKHALPEHDFIELDGRSPDLPVVLRHQESGRAASEHAADCPASTAMFENNDPPGG